MGEEAGLTRSARSGELTRLRRGAFLESKAWTALDREQQHLLLVLAAATAANRSPVFSHESAAVLSGFPIVDGLPDRVQVTVPPGSGLRSNKVVARHEAKLDPVDVIELEILPIRVTSMGRTLVDYAAGRSFLSGACAAEFVLHQATVTRERMLEHLDKRRPLRGSRKVEAVLRFASAKSASPNETLCRVRFDQLGFPQPEQQREYRGAAGQKYAVDFYWPEFDVIGESDGRVKYENPQYLGGRTPEQALWDEKLREDDLRSQCRALVRLTWGDAWNRAGLIAKLARAGIPRHR
jgi:predicted transcriptional regulator of viral defense system